MKKKRRKKCGKCKMLKDDVFKAIDPFIQEIYPEDANPKSLWCGDCYQDACDEI